MEKIIIRNNGGAPIAFPLDGKVVSLGRHDDNTIALNNKYLSQFHARLVRLPDQSGREIFDLDSYNGIKVNGQRIDRATLRDGDTIEFGLLTAIYETGVDGDHPDRTNGDGGRQELVGQGSETPDPIPDDVSPYPDGPTAMPAASGSKKTQVGGSAPREIQQEPASRKHGADVVDERIERTRAELASLKHEVGTKRWETATLSAKLILQRGELDAAEEALSKAREEDKKVSAEIGIKRSSLDELKQLTEAKNSKFASASERLQKLGADETRLAAIGQQLAAKAGEVQLARRQLEDIRTVSETIQDETKIANTILVTSSENLKRCSAEYEAVEGRLRDARKALETVDSKIQKKLDSMRLLEAEQREKMAPLDEELGRKTSELRAVETEQREKMAAVDEELGRKTDELRAVETEQREKLAAVDEELGRKTSEITVINSDLEMAAEKLAAAQDQMVLMEGRAEALQRASAEKESAANAKLDVLNDQLAKKTLQLEELDSRAEDLRRQVESEIARLATVSKPSQDSETPPEANTQADRADPQDFGQEAPETKPDPDGSKALEEELVRLGFRFQGSKREKG
jgi:hypothetical protein